jgi:hypothetical protein
MSVGNPVSRTRKHSNFCELGLISITFLLSVAFAQEPQPPQIPTFRAHTSLVLVDVITQDSKSGLPIRDFKKEDFHLFDNDREVQIASFDSGARYDTRRVAIWLVVICNEVERIAGSSQFVGKESLFRPALNFLDRSDTVGVAHWCDNGEANLDLLPTEDRDMPIEVLAKTIKPKIGLHLDAGTSQAGEAAFRKMVRLIIHDSYHRNPQPLPVVVFLDGDYTGQPLSDLNHLVDDFLETSGIVFGIKDAYFPSMAPLQHEQGEIMHYMADQTGGQFLAAPPADYSAALEEIILQLHFRYELGFAPRVIDGKRHKLKVELTDEAKEKHKGVRLRSRPEYIPSIEPTWTH